MNRKSYIYLETAAEPDAWTWVLGDGLETGWNCCVPFPVRRALWGNPAASLALGELMPADLVKAEHFRGKEYRALRSVYERLVASVGTECLFIRVSAERHSADRFAESAQQGKILPTRAMSRAAAMTLAPMTPFPVFFTHRRMPLFRDEEQRQDALALAGELLALTGTSDATWMRPEWGMRPGDDRGDAHYMRAVLRIVEQIDWDWPMVQEREAWQRARRFFKAVHFAEQVFGATWVTQVYVNELSFQPEMAQTNIRVIDKDRYVHHLEI